MSQVRIGFTKSKKKIPIGSVLIRLWTGREYSHVAKEVLRQDWGRAYYQASEGKVNYEHESVFTKKHQAVKSYILEVDRSVEMAIREACWKECGGNYGVMQNLGIALVDVLRVVGIKIANPWKQGRNCSELLYLNVLKAIDNTLDVDPDTVKPHHIEDMLLKLGYMEEKINNYT